MRTRHIEYDEDDDDDHILRDRGSLRVPMTLMDHELHDDLARRYPPRCAVTDAFGNPAGHRPGYVFLASIDDAASDARDAAWEERGRILQNVWRNPPNPYVSKSDSTEHRDRAKSEDRSRPADVEAAWQERGRLLREAWRNA